MFKFVIAAWSSSGLKGLHALSERPIEWEAMVETTGSPCAFIPVLNGTLLINFLVTTLGFQGCNWQPANSVVQQYLLDRCVWIYQYQNMVLVSVHELFSGW